MEYNEGGRQLDKGQGPLPTQASLNQGEDVSPLLPTRTALHSGVGSDSYPQL